MTLAAVLTMLLTQVLPSPLPSATLCPPTDVKRITKNGIPDNSASLAHAAKWCQGISCEVEEVLVTVNPDGTVKDAVVQRSWGRGFDDYALETARTSKYIPKTIDCKPVLGTYMYRVFITRW